VSQQSVSNANWLSKWRNAASLGAAGMWVTAFVIGFSG
jgi:hypothetical protein